MRALCLVLAVAACGEPLEPAPDAYVPTQTGALGLNDVTFLLPLPADPVGATTLLRMTDGGELVPRALFTRLVTTPGDVGADYGQFHVVAVRFDLCDRAAPGPCPAGLDGRLRLVLQPLFGATGGAQALDVALHAFYPIPAGELGGVVDELRALAGLGGIPTDAALAVNAPVAADPAYAARLRALVLAHARPERLFRVTLFTQNLMSAAFNWTFRGVVRDGASYADIVIPDLGVAQQRTLLSGGVETSYATTPLADAPAGVALALDDQQFAAASPADRRSALEALAAAENPTLHTAETVQCVACHVSTFLGARRSTFAAIDPASLGSRFASTYDLSIAAGVSATNNRSLRNLGWLFDEPAISQRVANETAQALTEIAQRFPPAR